MTDARIVLTTLDDIDRADQLARTLVESRLAACVNRIEPVHSVYRWQDGLETSEEVLLIIKTSVERIPALKETIQQLHPYEIPEFIVLPVTDGTAPYLDWLLASSRNDPK